MDNLKVEICKIQTTLLSAPKSLMPNDSVRVQCDSIDTNRCRVYSRMKLGFRNIEVLLSGLTAIFKTWICKDINYPNSINFQLLLLLALSSSETWTRLNTLARVKMRQPSRESEKGLHFWANLDNLKLHYVVLLVKTQEVPDTALGIENRK